MAGKDMVVQKKTISTQVADLIRKRILSGEYKAGHQLRQEHIATDIGVSRIPVREALHQLHSEGFVTLVSHKGAIVSKISLEEILEMYELRARIETWLLALAIPQMTEADLQHAKECAELFGQEGQHSEYSHELNWAFHTALYAPSKRAATIEMVGRIHQQIERYTRMMVNLAGSQEKSHREHLILLDLCRERDTLRAVNLLDMHIIDGGKFLVKSLSELRDQEQSELQRVAEKS
ncbi:GntR family transcriptional regulator [Pseudomonas sp. LB3P38]|uniref:GntR family transcriptional regulator n=1 Tax=Pseudomonas lyxosi TaxID=3398358 RepID=UPI0039EFE900